MEVCLVWPRARGGAALASPSRWVKRINSAAEIESAIAGCVSSRFAAHLRSHTDFDKKDLVLPGALTSLIDKRRGELAAFSKP